LRARRQVPMAPLVADRNDMLKRIYIDRTIRGLVLLGAIILCGCEKLGIKDTTSLLSPKFQRSEILGLVAGFGTTFAAVPDLFRMFRRQSSQGINPTMAGIMGVFQIVWVYYGLLIASRPVILWNFIAVIINFMTVWAYFRFARREMNKATE
jgi:MtN3 and saliva related transmembrane protein